MLNETTKKEFQKVIGTIRKGFDKELRYETYPKAMMTDKQMFLDTATVNCGADWFRPENVMLWQNP